MAAVVSFAVLISGCGGDDDFANSPRRPTPISVAATIAPSRVSVSPSRFGAGPIELLASNQTTSSQRLTLRSAAAAADSEPLQQSTGPINPGDTASLSADLAPGSYTVSVGAGAIAPARIEAGAPRPSGQDRRMQP